MRLGLVVHPGRREAEEVARRVVKGSEARGMEVVARPQDADRIGSEAGDVAAEVAVLVAVGGDGTVLQAVALALEADVPVLGVNAGRVGYMAEIEPEHLDRALDALAAGGWNESRRITVQAELPDGARAVGLNEVVLEKLHGPRAVALAVEVDGEPFMTYHADGVLVATPTGSTAYNFSAGGPLVDPELEALVLTPVAPHALFGRSMVVPASVRLGFTVEHDRPVEVSVDGRQVGRLEAGDRVEVGRGPRPVRFVRLSGDGFATAVRTKLGLERA